MNRIPRTLLTTALAVGLAVSVPPAAATGAGGPVLTLPDEMTVDGISPSGAPVDYVATAVDGSGTDLPVACDRGSGSTFPRGTTTVTCRAIDAAGTASSGSFTVHVRGAAEELTALATAVTGSPAPSATLAAKVATAARLVGAGKTAQACTALGSFDAASRTAYRNWELLQRSAHVQGVQGCTAGRPAVVTFPGLTGHWTGDGTVRDELGGPPARLAGGAEYGLGHLGDAFILDGQQGFVEVPDTRAIHGARGVLTISLWVRFDDLTGDQILVEKWVQRLAGDTSTGWTIQKTAAGTIALYSAAGGAETPRLKLVPYRWYHVAARIGPRAITLFVDGAVAGSGTLDRSRLARLVTAAPLKLGHRGGKDDTPGAQTFQGLYLHGAIDDVQFYGATALTDAQVARIHAAGAPGAAAVPPVGMTTLQLGDIRPVARVSLTPSPTMPDNKVGTAIGTIDPPFFDTSYLYPIGFRWVHLIGDDALSWQSVEKTPGVYAIATAADAVVTGYAAHGLTIVMTLGIGESANAVYGQHLANAEEIRRYGEYVRFMVRHFKDRVRYFELWNEPAGPITLESYVAMVRHVVPIIRAEDPAAKIVIGAVAGGWETGDPGYGSSARYTLDAGTLDWLDGLIDSGVLPLVDAISWHPLFGDRADDPYYQGYPDLVRQIQARAEANGFHGEYQAGEMCWRTPQDNLDPDQLRYSDVVATKYLIRTTVTHRGLGTVVIIAPGNGIRYPSITDTNVLLAGAMPIALPVTIATTATHLRQYAFALPDGSHLVALWDDWLPSDRDPGTPATVTIDGLAGASAVAYDVMAGISQPLVTSASGGALVVKDLLVKDYPIFVRVSK